MDQALCKSVDGGFGGSSMRREGKPIVRISICCSKDEALSFLQGKWPGIVILHQVDGWSPWVMMSFL